MYILAVTSYPQLVYLDNAMSVAINEEFVIVLKVVERSFTFPVGVCFKVDHDRAGFPLGWRAQFLSVCTRQSRSNKSSL